MKNIFKETQFNRVKYSKFDLSHDRKFSTKMGSLTPIMVNEVLPGDKFNLTSEQMIRLAPMLAPVMHRVDVYTHFFFVPNRIVWKGWEDFISPDDPASVPVHPTIRNDEYVQGSLADYMGIPTDVFQNFEISALPIAAYNKIYNDYYRDQNLVAPVIDTCQDGWNQDLQNAAANPPLKRAWEHDYFTACLPFAQKGDPVSLPLSGTADVNYNFNNIDTWKDGTGQNLIDDVSSVNGAIIYGQGANAGVTGFDSNADPARMSVDNSANLEVDLSTATSSTITDFRRALRLQEWLEKNARGGTRYIESIFSHFGVSSSDKRLQRPEYLGGGKSPVMISEVMQNSANANEPTPIGTMAGHGMNVGQTHQFSKRFEEHGYIIGIMSVIPKTAYSQGLPRQYMKTDTLDYAFPSFAHIGEQEVYNKEVVADHIDPEGTFGYIPRYSEYRYHPSTVHGDFRGNLDFWHMGRNLPQTVALNEDFITCDATKRIFAVTDPNEDELWCHVYNKVSAVRPLPKYGIPKI